MYIIDNYLIIASTPLLLGTWYLSISHEWDAFKRNLHLEKQRWESKELSDCWDAGAAPQRYRIHDWCTDILERCHCTFLFKGPWSANMNLMLTCDPANITTLCSNFANFPKDPSSNSCSTNWETVFSTPTGSVEKQRMVAQGFVRTHRFHSFLSRIPIIRGTRARSWRDTTSSALTWFIWLVSRHPIVENKIIEELQSKIPEDETGKKRLLKAEEEIKGMNGLKEDAESIMSTELQPRKKLKAEIQIWLENVEDKHGFRGEDVLKSSKAWTWGMGGVGKISIMKVYKQATLKETGKFDIVIRITVSKETSIAKLQKTLLVKSESNFPVTKMKLQGRDSL
ncbi:hypothetical protein F3Y22_tig00111754pilonHSYRG00107 [Hibiscus syriacus]|uniref:NB-ARC domain-containing protein n=1 Tax=Hibiscus syriacus TaxID=106335 RepID=A0A6A2YED0_HIBSY|nr:hypothetical protein F3Y22_tig00111754pilonHSYRG00107 [Hibiscus syriacus]